MYIPPANFSFEELALSRRSFIKSCSVLALCFAGCETFSANARFTKAMINAPHPDDYLAVLHSLITSILPFDDTRFPKISPDEIGKNLLNYFPIKEKEKYISLQKGLIFFDSVNLFPQTFSPVANEDILYLKNMGEQDIDSTIKKKTESDVRLYSDFSRVVNSPEAAFTQISLENQRTYLHMWGQSSFILKRQFYRSVKSIIMISAYTQNDLWETIGYEGPLLTKK